MRKRERIILFVIAAAIFLWSDVAVTATSGRPNVPRQPARAESIPYQFRVTLHSWL